MIVKGTAKYLTASILAVAAALPVSAQSGAAGGGAAPQASPTAADEGLADIVVTATRQATNLQSTPLAITAVTSDTLAQRSVVNTADLGAIVPNATFRPAQGAYGPSVTAFIRGIGQADGSLASEPGVAFYVDDVYYPLILGSQFDLLDLDHVEVLRGPQGTLFGRNALAGAVNLVSKAPDPREAGGYAEITYGQYQRLNLRAGFNLPLGEHAALRVSGVAKSMTGYQKRLDFRCQMVKNGTPQLAGNFPYADGNLIRTAGNDPDNCVVGHNGGENVRAVRAALLVEPAEGLKITLTGDYLRDNSSVTPDSLLSVNAAAAAANTNARIVAGTFTAPGGPTFAYDNRFVTGDPYTTYATYRDPVSGAANIPGTFYNGSATRGGIGYEPVNPVKQWGFSGKGVYAITPHIDATVILAYRNVLAGYTFDVDGSPLNLETTHNVTTHRQYTAEARLSGKSSFIEWTGGLFYYRAHELARLFVMSPWLNLQRVQHNTYEPESKSAFANVTIHPFTDRLGITLGGRYSNDKKPVHYDNRQDGVPSGDIVFSVTPKQERFDWKAGLSYQLTNSTLLYGSASTGFRLPSFNARPLQPSQVYQIPGDNLIAYEAGIKTDLFAHKLRVNATGFYTDYKDRASSISGQEYLLDQTTGKPQPGGSVTIPLPGGPAGSTTCRPLTSAEIAAGTPGFACVGRAFVTNVPGKIRGAELEIEAHPIPHLTINFSGGYSKFTAADLKAAARVNKRLLGIPDWNGSGGIQYEIEAPLLGGSVTPRIDWFYTGSIAFSANNVAYNQSPYSTFNGRLTYTNRQYDATLSLNVTNMFNKFYYYNYFVYTELGYSNVNAQPARPRMWSVTLAKKF